MQSKRDWAQREEERVRAWLADFERRSLEADARVEARLRESQRLSEESRRAQRRAAAASRR